MKAPSAARASELPTLMRLTPMAEQFVQAELHAGKPHHHIDGQVSAPTRRAISSRERRPGA